MCQCPYCELLIMSGARYDKGAGVAVVSYYNMMNGGKTRAIMLGKERFGKYQNLYNVCSGKKNNMRECFVMTAARELAEEFKIGFAYLNDPHQLQNKFIDHCIGRDGLLNFIIHRGTPIFIFYVDGISRRKINDIITVHNYSNMSFSYQEIDRVDWFRLSSVDGYSNTIKIIPESSNVHYRDGHPFTISNFARAVCIRILNSGILPAYY